MTQRNEPQGRTVARQALFLVALTQEPNITDAAREAGVHRSTVYEWRKDPESQVRFQDAMDRSVDDAEAAGYRRAVDGWLEPKWVSGEADPKWIRKYDHGLLRWYVDRHRPVKSAAEREADALETLEDYEEFLEWKTGGADATRPGAVIVQETLVVSKVDGMWHRLRWTDKGEEMLIPCSPKGLAVVGK